MEEKNVVYGEQVQEQKQVVNQEQPQEEKHTEQLVKQEDVVKVVQEFLDQTNSFITEFIQEYGINKKSQKWVQKGFITDLIDTIQQKLNSLEVFMFESQKPLKELVKKEQPE